MDRSGLKREIYEIWGLLLLLLPETLEQRERERERERKLFFSFLFLVVLRRGKQGINVGVWYEITIVSLIIN